MIIFGYFTQFILVGNGFAGLMRPSSRVECYILGFNPNKIEITGKCKDDSLKWLHKKETKNKAKIVGKCRDNFIQCLQKKDRK